MDNRIFTAADRRTASAVALQTSLTHDADADFTLPDYMPAIRRIVSVDVQPLPESRFLTGAALEFGGTAAFSVLYIGEDNRLFCAPLSTEYSAAVALGGAPLDDASAAMIDTETESITCRVTAPRKLTVRTRLRSRVFACTRAVVTDQIEGGTVADELYLERRIREAPDLLLFRGAQTAAATASMRLPPDTQIIRCRGAVRLEEAIAETDSIRASGDVIVRLLCRDGEGRFVTMEMKGTLRESIPVSGAEPGDHCRAWGRCASITVREDENGVTADIECDLEAECVRTAVMSYTVDAYSTACTAALTMTERESLHLLRCGNSSVSVSGTIGRRSKVNENETIVQTDASVSADQIEYENGTLTLHGTAAVSILFAADGEVFSEEGTIPFCCSFPCEAAPAGEVLLRCCAETIRADARPDGEKNAVDLDVVLSFTVLSREKIRCVSSIIPDRNSSGSKNRNLITVCYPAAGESLWEIGKRYGTALRTVCEANGIADPEGVSDGSPLLIR